MSHIIDTVTALAEPIVTKNDCEIWDVEYVKEAGNWFLRIFIDRPDGISINHCEAISRELDPILDEHEDMFHDGYTFEISSAGVERKLRGPSDFERFSGRPVEVKLYKSKDGQKIFSGKLIGWDADGLSIDISGVLHSFSAAEVASVRLRLELRA